MSNGDGLSGRNRSLFERLVCEEGLGYCCPAALFRVTKRTGMIAARLGMTDRTVRLWKARFKAKEIGCEKQPNCLHRPLKDMGK